MLDSFRKASQSWFIKILFALLILSFGGLWGAGGLGDLMQGRLESQPAIVVGSEEIPASEVTDQFRRDVERLQAMFGNKMTPEQARQFGLMQRTIEQIIGRHLLDQAADGLKLAVDDATLRRMIAETPAFQNELHVFDKNVYQRALSHAGFSERQFVSLESRDVTREQLTAAVTAAVKAPNAMAESLFRYRHEQRVAETVTFETEKMTVAAKPDEAMLKQFHSAHTSQFMSPEFRGISAVVVTVADLSGGIRPSDEDIQKAYDVRQAEFQTTEKRSLQQVVFDDQSKAADFVAAVTQGKDFAASAKAAGKEVSDLGQVDRAGMPLPALANAAFGSAGPGVVGPVQTPLGWHVLRVATVVPGTIRHLAEVREQIVQDLIRDEATNRLYALSTKLEDTIGSGAGIDEAASTLGVTPVKVAAIDQHGNGPDGKPATKSPLAPEVLAKAFEAAQGSTTEVTQLADNAGYFVLHVDTIVAPALKPFDKVRDQVLSAWTQQQKEQESRRQAEAAAERLRKGQPLAAMAGSLKIETTEPFPRNGGTAKGGVPPLLAAEMFKLTGPGGVAVVTVPNGTMVARLKTILPASAVTQSAEYERGRTELSQAISGDLMQEYVGALRKDLGVTVNNTVIDQQTKQ